MARWRLTESHYINLSPEGIDGEPIMWDQKEISTQTGRQRTKRHSVPAYLDILDPTLHNAEGGFIVVSNGNNPGGRDYIFLGEPTPAMEPLDDEAREISDACSHKWQHPIDSLPTQGVPWGDSLIRIFEQQIADLGKKEAKPVAVPATGAVDPEQFAELQRQVQALMARNVELEAKAVEPKDERRV